MLIFLAGSALSTSRLLFGSIVVGLEPIFTWAQTVDGASRMAVPSAAVKILWVVVVSFS
jgi:hypothetical protein